MLEILLMKLSSDEYRWTFLMVSQYWFRWWLGAVRQQAITWANVDPDLCRHMASLGPNELSMKMIAWHDVLEYVMTHWLKCKTAVSPLLTHWRYRSLLLSNSCMVGLFQVFDDLKSTWFMWYTCIHFQHKCSETDASTGTLKTLWPSDGDSVLPPGKIADEFNILNLIVWSCWYKCIDTKWFMSKRHYD